MSLNCRAINNVLFRRQLQFDKRISRDRFPQSFMYSNMYKQSKWPQAHGTQIYRDRVHVTMPNDDGCWDQVVLGGDSSATGCDALCAPSRKVIGYGSTRYSYVKYHRDYTTPPMCLDQMRDTEEIIQQLDARLDGLKKMPDKIVSDFLRLLSLRQAETIWIAGADDVQVTITADTFTNNCTRIALGSADNLPDSQLTMNYLDNHIENLMYNGYFNQEFLPEGIFAITSDMQTQRNLKQQNPALAQMWCLGEFAKGGKYWEYGLNQEKVGNWMFKMDKEPLRFQHIGGGVLERIWPFENVATTVGLMPQFSEAYKNAPYQAYHVFNRDAREVFVGDVQPVNPELKFNMSRDMLGKWSWKSPDFFRYTDPNTGLTCEYANDKGNYGYLLGEYELGAVTDYPLIEMWIIALRQPQCVTNSPLCGSQPAQAYQSLIAYNDGCGEGDE
jgi:hypothetical protein